MHEDDRRTSQRERHSIKLKFEVHDMYGFISGITDTNDINYCPKCGAVIAAHRADGTARCLDCGFHFGVVECEEDKED